MKIHPVVSIIHLEPALDDPYKRAAPKPPPITIDGEDRYIIDRILQKQLRKVAGKKDKIVHYKIRWQGYSAKDDQWIPREELMEQIPDMVEEFDKHVKPKDRRHAST